MLMYAEIVGPTDEGVRLVNKIRTRAGLAELSAVQKTENAFLQCVEDERRRELAFEGIRWHDLVRHNTYMEKVRAKFRTKQPELLSMITISITYSRVLIFILSPIRK